MTVLCDTSVVLWSLLSPERLGPETHKRLLQKETDAFVSVLSLWEIAIKHRIGKLAINKDQVLQGLHDAAFTLVDFTPAHLDSFNSVALKHRDPFDHGLCSVSRSVGVPLLTSDEQILMSAENTLDARL